MDYDLTKLGSRDFEHLVQALSIQVLGPGIEIFGDGPDGGREASFQGLSTFPSGGNPWPGYGVLQAKFRQRPEGTAKDAQWLVKRIRDELRSWADPEKNRVRRGRVPEYFLIATNVVLSSKPSSGGIDHVSEEIERLKQELHLPVKDFRVWHFDTICRLLDTDENIRRTYTGAVMTGDVLSRLLETLEGGVPKDAVSGVAAPAGLPRELRQLIGRDRELREGLFHLESADATGGRAVTITGPPGIGKSVLGLRLARHCAETFPDGQYHVDLTPAIPGAERADPVPELLRVLRPADTPLPQARQQQVQLLRSTLAQCQALILIDDIVSEPALLELLSIEGPFALVCTSRTKLSGLSGLAHFIELDPLPEHHGRELVRSVVGQGKLTDEQIDHLVRACAGHPLALHVAAAHLARRPRINIDAYLGDIVNPDHAMRALVAGQTALEPVIEQSFADLDPPQRQLLERLGMMPHMSVTPDIAAAVTTAEGTSIDEALIQEAAQLLDSLFESGLIEQADEDRYVFHEILHRFARSKSASAEQRLRGMAVRRACQVLAIRARTAIHAIGFTDDEAQTAADSNEQALQILEADRPGAVAMMELAHKHCLWDPLVLLVADIAPWLAHASHWKDIVRVSEWLLDAGSESDTPEWRTAALHNLGTAYSRTGETDSAVDFYRRSALSAHESKDPYLGFMAQLAFAELLIDLGQAQEAIRLLRDGLRFWRHIEDETILARVLGNLGCANLLLGRLRRAEQYLSNSERLTNDTDGSSPRVRSARSLLLRRTGRTAEATQRACDDIERARAVGNRDWEAQSLTELSLTAARDRPPSAPEDPLTLALEIYRDTNDVRNQVQTLYLLGTQTAQEKEIPKAIEYLAECADLAATIGDSERMANSLAYLASFSGSSGRLEEAEAYFTEAQSAASNTGNPLVLAHVHRRKANHYRTLGRSNEAVPLLVQAINMMERTDDTRNLEMLRADLGETLVAVGRWQEGAEILHKVLSITSSNTSNEARAQAQRAFGILCYHRELYAESETLIHQALEYHEETSDRPGIMHCRMALGNLYAQQDDWPRGVGPLPDNCRDRFRTQGTPSSAFLSSHAGELPLQYW